MGGLGQRRLLVGMMVLLLGLITLARPAASGMSAAAMTDGSRALSISAVGMAARAPTAPRGPTLTPAWASTASAFDCLARCTRSARLPSPVADCARFPLHEHGACPAGLPAGAAVGRAPFAQGCTCDIRYHRPESGTRRALLQVYLV